MPDGTVWFGSPAKQAREMTAEDIAANKHNAKVYVDLARDARTVDLIEAVNPDGE